jgi:hypothetical protein
VICTLRQVIIRIIKSRTMRGGTCSPNGEMINAYRLLVEKPEGKRSLGGPRRRWVGNIKIGELLCMRLRTFEFHKMLGSYQVAT